MSRKFSEIATASARGHLEELLARATAHDADGYRAAMTVLGRDLGGALAAKLSQGERVMVVCTVEDADFLTRGLIEAISTKVGPADVVLACFWNGRRKLGDRHPIEVAPITNRYLEPLGAPGVETVVVTKSIIRGGCVVRTNLSEILEMVQPRRIFVAAPVMLKGAREGLSSEFPKRVSKKFEYLYLAEDSVRENDEVKPGVGGSVYQLLGLGDVTQKNRHHPRLLAERSQRMTTSGWRFAHSVNSMPRVR